MRSGVAEARLRPEAVDNGQPLRRPFVARVVLVEGESVLKRFIAPPRRNDIERDAALADLIDAGRMFCEERGMMKGRTHGHHQLQPVGDRGQRGRGRPCVETRLVDTFDVVQIQFGEETDVVSDLFTADGQIAHVTPARLHPLVVDVAQPNSPKIRVLSHNET